MPYKQKPNKSMLKRVKITKTGKLKRHHSNTSHLMSGRSPAKKRELRGSALVANGFARVMRRLMCVSHLNPKRLAHQRALRDLQAKKAVAAAAAE